LLGIITDGDIRRLFELYDRVSDIKVRNIYTKDPKTISENTLAMEAIKIMEDNKITTLVVTNKERKIIGLLHIHHLLENGFY
jgi:arabinose-5-phosphate isomerase